jgi:hypothetical protein
MINTYREIKGINDIGKEVYFYDYVKKEYYLKGILKGFDCGIFEIETKEGIKNFQVGYIKEELK